MKARIRNTGEIVDVINYSNRVNRGDKSVDYVSYIDSKGNEHHYEAGMNFYWDFESIEDDVKNNTINWEQRRYEIAKAAMQGILSNQDQVDFACSQADYGDGRHLSPMAFAQYAVACADALIVELKKK